MSTANRVIKNTGYLYAKMGVTMFISLYTTRLILNSLGATDFGIFNIVGGAIAMLGFLNAAMAGATQRFMSYTEGEGNKEKQKSIFNVSVVLHLLISLLVGVVLLIAGYFFFNGILNIPTDRVFAAQVVYGSLIVRTMFTVMTVPYDAVLNAHENMLYYSIVGIIESVLKLIVAFIVVYTLSDKLIVYGILMACIPLITMSIMRVYCHKHYEECIIQLRKYWHKGLMKEMSSFAGWNLLGSTSTILSGYGLGLVLNHFYGTIANAAQGIANQVSGQLGTFGSSIKKALNPVITKSAGAKDNTLMLRAAITGSKITFFIVTIFFIPVLVDADYILKLWLKTPPQYSNSFCILLLITNILQNLTLFIPQAIASVGKIKKYSLWSSIINFLPVLLTIIGFILGMSPEFLYISMIIGTIIKIICDLYFGQILCKINAFSYTKSVIFSMLFCVSLGILVGEIIKQTMQPSFIRFIIIAIVSMLSYLYFFYIISFNKEEKNMTYAMFLKLKQKIYAKR